MQRLEVSWAVRRIYIYMSSGAKGLIHVTLFGAQNFDLDPTILENSGTPGCHPASVCPYNTVNDTLRSNAANYVSCFCCKHGTEA